MIITLLLPQYALADTSKKADYDFYSANDIEFFDPSAQRATQCGGTSVNGSGMKAIYAYLLSIGLTPEQAAGAAGNISIETGDTGSPTISQALDGGRGHTDDPSVFTSGGQAYGIIQWDPGAKIIGLFRDAKITSPVNSLDGQLKLMEWHMKNSTPTGRTGFDTAFRAITDVTEAASYWQSHMEGTTSHLQERINAAKLILSTYPKTASSTPSSGDAGCGTGATAECSVTAPIHGESGTKDHRQLSKDQLISAFGTGGPEGESQNITSTTFMGKSLKVNKKIVGCLKAVEDEIKASGSTYAIKEIGGFRSERGTGQVATDAGYHWYGAAIDINPKENPYGDGSQPLPHDMPQAYIDAFHHHGFSWGGNWPRPKDYMHFEFNGVDPS